MTFHITRFQPYTKMQKPSYFLTGDPSTRVRRGDRESARGNVFVSQTSSVTEAPSDEIDDMDAETPRVTS